MYAIVEKSLRVGLGGVCAATACLSKSNQFLLFCFFQQVLRKRTVRYIMTQYYYYE